MTTGKTAIEKTSINRRQPLLAEKNDKQQHKRIGEVAGGTTAECAAVCCCCPWTVMNLVIMTFYKVPKGLCKKAIRKRRRKKLIKHRNALLKEKQEKEEKKKNDDSESDGEDCAADDGGGSRTTVDLDDEMWDRFHSGGFWRNPHGDDDDGIKIDLVR